MAASDREDFERAARLRDALRWLERLEEPSSVELIGTGEADAIGYARDGDDAVGVLIRVRGGRVISATTPSWKGSKTRPMRRS